MRRSRLAIGVAVLLSALAGCASAPPEQDAETPTAVVTSTPTPTPDVLNVAPGGIPPVAFGHDCASVLTEAQLSDATGLDLQSQSADSSGTMANVGGLVCAWRGDSATVVVEVIPQSGVGDAVLPADSEKYYFEDCDPQWVCAWKWESHELWVAGTFQFAPDMTRANVDAWGAALGAQIGANFAARPDEPWTRDRTGWWPTLDCQRAADAIGGALGATLTGQATSLGDPPTPGYAMAGVASHRSECGIAERGASSIFLYLDTLAGTGATTPDGYQAIDLGVDGIQGSAGGTGSHGGALYHLADGVNSAWIEVRATAALQPEMVAAAVARAAASGFH
ncbi:hypothetical protein [Microbacterium deminutum]|uniref:DUF3558 domain-containing protein n=1 Tax=Microbacterium deminutum TaxID=344164 RepID=A0ABN2Q498_9MICO